MKKNNDESSLLQRLKAGDRSAFDHLFHQHYKYLLGMAYSYTKDRHISKDLVQNVFLDLWRRRDSIEIRISMRAFLKRAVINQSMLAIKKSKRIHLSGEVLNPESSMDIGDESSERYNKIKESINKGVAELPDRCQLIFKMSRYDELSHKEIAAILDISTKTIENQMTKALRLLRERIKKSGLLTLLA